jgi:hypothetical protein
MKSHYNKFHSQQGGALIILLVVLVLAGMSAFFISFSSTDFKVEREKKTATSLAEAKVALVGYAVRNTTVTGLGYLPNPDLGPGMNVEGSSVAAIGGVDISVVGKLPWRTLGIAMQKDGADECLWYVVSGRLKVNPATGVLNWDTLGQIDVMDVAGNLLATNVAAMIIAPGQSLNGQNRQLVDAGLVHCGGNYDARNYLDAYDLANAIAGQVNYYSGSVNNRLAGDTANKQFILANNGFYNDRFSFITVEDIFSIIIRRSDFSAQITNLLDDPDFRLEAETKVVSGPATKGTDNIVCNNLSNLNNRTFCNHWKEMLLLTQLPVADSIMIDGAATASCSRVVIFGGKRLAGQTRLVIADKNTPANYLEGINVAAFATPVANNNSFSGVSVFSPNDPSADVMRCL